MIEFSPNIELTVSDLSKPAACIPVVQIESVYESEGAALREVSYIQS